MGDRLYFEGYGYFKVNADNYYEALEKFFEEAAKIGIDFTLEYARLEDANRMEI